MLLFWSLAALLIAVTLGLLLWPLWRRHQSTHAPDADSAAIAVHRDQKHQLDAELAAGTITPVERDAALAELARRVADEVAESPAAAVAASPHRRAWVVGIILLVVIPVAAVVLYARLGHPDATAVATSTADGNAHELSDSQIVAMVDSLAERLQSRPNDAEGWTLLARSYAALGRFSESAAAYAHAETLLPGNADLLADYADTLAMAQGRKLAGKPMELVKRALAIDRTHKKALALAATGALEARDNDSALRYWRALAAQLPEGSDDARQVHALIDRIEAAKVQGKPFASMAPDATAPSAAGSRAPELGENPATAASISGLVDLDSGLAAKVALNDTVFIFARPADGSRMPLAVLRVGAKELPKEFALDDSMGMGQGAKLSSASAVIVEARVSKSGNAIPQSGDLFGKSAPVKPGATGVHVTIDQIVP